MCELKNHRVKLPNITKIDIILGVNDIEINMILLLYKLILYKSRGKGITPSLVSFKNTLRNFEKIENLIAKSRNKIKTHGEKWKNIVNALIV